MLRFFGGLLQLLRQQKKKLSYNRSQRLFNVQIGRRPDLYTALSLISTLHAVSEDTVLAKKEP